MPPLAGPTMPMPSAQTMGGVGMALPETDVDVDTDADPGLMDDDELDDLLRSLQQPRIGPVLPPNFKKPPRPKKEWVIERANQDAADHQLWLLMIGELLQWLRGDRVGHFEGDEERIENNEIEVGRSNALMAQHDMMCRLGSRMATAFDCPYLDEVDKEEARDKEDALAYWRRCAIEQHSERCGQNLNWAEFDLMGKYGTLIGMTKLDPEAPGGLKKALLDPGTTFPTFGGDRVLYVTRVYTAEAATVVGMFRDADGKVERQIMGGINKRTSEKRKPRDRVNVSEFIDHWWHGVYVEQDELLVTEHGFNKVPITVEHSPLGDQLFTVTPTAISTQRDATTPEELMAGGFGTERQVERCRKALPFLLHQLPTHAQKETVRGIWMTLLKRMRDPAFIHARDALMESEPLEAVSQEPGEVTAIGLEDRIEPVPLNIQPQIAAVVAAFMAEDDALMGVPRSLAGQMPGSQTTGTALDILNEAQADQYWPVFESVARYRAREARLNLYLFAAFEPIMGDWGAKGAGITIPRRGASALRLTREMVQRTGTDVDVTLHRFDLSRAAQAATTANILSAAGLAPKVSLIDALGYTTDPERAMEQIRTEQFMETPEMTQMAQADHLVAQEKLAIRRGDEESYRVIKAKQARLASMAQMNDMMKLKMAGQLQSAGPPPPSEERLPGALLEEDPNAPLPGEDMGLPDVGMQGASMPMYGRPAGTQGGRPPMPPLAPGVGQGGF